ncbi:MAG: hypothetical protein ACLVJN_05950 [Streptococcus parasanguinis]
MNEAIEFYKNFKAQAVDQDDRREFGTALRSSEFNKDRMAMPSTDA